MRTLSDYVWLAIFIAVIAVVRFTLGRVSANVAIGMMLGAALMYQIFWRKKPIPAAESGLGFSVVLYYLCELLIVFAPGVGQIARIVLGVIAVACVLWLTLRRARQLERQNQP